VLDIGSSTGGFTDFALQNGAERVYAVDVGTNQLDGRLRGNEKIVLMEKTDIRAVRSLPEKVDIVLADVSFISLRKILPGIANLLRPSAQIVAMVKPQFEADKQTASKHKGVIKNDRIRREILKDFEQWSREYFVIDDKADSGVAGAKGNVERFYLLRPAK
jgi:23S rRNA (cytidine1920-2'-O)/16S rRNA (cytidine1409-2'-O)-methyltransferase